jgi:redox-regulated HSP33 family molecular chaperone
MHYLYGSKSSGSLRLVATFDSDQQLRAYVRWATLKSDGERHGKFEQGSVLATSDAWESADHPLSDEEADAVDHNPTPSML